MGTWGSGGSFLGVVWFFVLRDSGCWRFRFFLIRVFGKLESMGSILVVGGWVRGRVSGFSCGRVFGEFLFFYFVG